MRENDLIFFWEVLWIPDLKDLSWQKNPALLKVSARLPRSKGRYKLSQNLNPIVQGLFAYIGFGFLSVLDSICMTSNKYYSTYLHTYAYAEVLAFTGVPKYTHVLEVVSVSHVDIVTTSVNKGEELLEVILKIRGARAISNQDNKLPKGTNIRRRLDMEGSKKVVGLGGVVVAGASRYW